MAYLTVRQLAQKHPAFPEPSLRWLIFSDPKFNDACVRRVHGKVTIDEERFEHHVDEEGTESR